ESAYVVTRDTPGRFPLAASGKAASLFVSSTDYPGVARAARSFRADLAAVTKTEPVVLSQLPSSARDIVIVGTIGQSPIIDALVRERKLDVSDVAGRWETFVTQIVDAPAPGIEHALVIAGSDKRGTIYGIYDLSSQIGVSPWSWWADVPIRQQANLFVLA